MSGSKATVGFIGVGMMGAGMAKNLLAKGHPLVILGHRKREPVDIWSPVGFRPLYWTCRRGSRGTNFPISQV